MQPSARQAAHKAQQSAVALLPHKDQRQQEHRCQQDQVGERIADGRVQTLLRKIINGRFGQPGINLCGQFDVFQIVPGAVVLKNRYAGQLGRLGLHTLQKIAVARHGVVLVLQLAEQAVFGIQIVGKQRIGFVVVFLLVGIEHGGIVLPKLGQRIVAVGQLPIILPDFDKAFYLLAFFAQVDAFFLRGFAVKLRPHRAVGRRWRLLGGGAGTHPQQQKIGRCQYCQQDGEHSAAPDLAEFSKKQAHLPSPSPNTFR